MSSGEGQGRSVFADPATLTRVQVVTLTCVTLVVALLLAANMAVCWLYRRASGEGERRRRQRDRDTNVWVYHMHRSFNNSSSSSGPTEPAEQQILRKLQIARDNQRAKLAQQTTTNNTNNTNNNTTNTTEGNDSHSLRREEAQALEELEVMTDLFLHESASYSSSRRTSLGTTATASDYHYGDFGVGVGDGDGVSDDGDVRRDGSGPRLGSHGKGGFAFSGTSTDRHSQRGLPTSGAGRGSASSRAAARLRSHSASPSLLDLRPATSTFSNSGGGEGDLEFDRDPVWDDDSAPSSARDSNSRFLPEDRGRDTDDTASARRHPDPDLDPELSFSSSYDREVASALADLDLDLASALRDFDLDSDKVSTCSVTLADFVNDEGGEGSSGGASLRRKRRSRWSRRSSNSSRGSRLSSRSRGSSRASSRELGDRTDHSPALPVAEFHNEAFEFSAETGTSVERMNDVEL